MRTFLIALLEVGVSCVMLADAYVCCVGVDWRRTAILNPVADATHNFTDGLAIGVAFGRGEHEVATTLGKTWISVATVHMKRVMERASHLSDRGYIHL